MQHKAVMTWFPEEFVDTGVLAEAGIALDLKSCDLDDEDQLIAAARDADAVVILGMQTYTRRVLEQLPRCRLIGVLGIGYDGVDVKAATDLGICVANNPHYCVEELSEHTLAFLLTLARRVVPLDRAVKTGRWTKLVTPEINAEILAPVRRLSSLTLGIVGFGSAGRTLARKAQALGLRVIATDVLPTAQTRAREMGVPALPLERLLQEADFISLHSALTEENRGMIGMAELRLMKPTAYLLNTARGGLVDQEALITALSEGEIAGAALDVMEPEPLPPDSPLLQMDNVLLTPHAAYFSQESVIDLWRHPFEEVVKVLRGEWPAALLNDSVKEIYVRRWGPMR